MSKLKLNHVTDAETADSGWSWLYKIGGAAALLVVVILPIQIMVYIVSPPPSTAIDYFTLFQSNSLLGLLALDLLIIVDIFLGIPLLLSLYIALRRSSESFMVIALSLGFLGSTAYIASNTAFNLKIGTFSNYVLLSTCGNVIQTSFCY
jgi:hypothetical protein